MDLLERDPTTHPLQQMMTMRWALNRKTGSTHCTIPIIHDVLSPLQEEHDIGIAPPTGRASYAASSSILNDIPKNDQVCLATKKHAVDTGYNTIVHLPLNYVIKPMDTCIQASPEIDLESRLEVGVEPTAVTTSV